MPDITMCMGGDCLLKENCYRYKAKPDELWQSYFVEIPYKNGECNHYWEMEMSSKPSKKLDKKVKEKLDKSTQKVKENLDKSTQKVKE